MKVTVSRDEKGVLIGSFDMGESVAVRPLKPEEGELVKYQHEIAALDVSEPAETVEVETEEAIQPKSSKKSSKKKEDE